MTEVKTKAAGKSKAKVLATPPKVKTRMSPAERERQIIDGAISYFAEVGFSGQTRELSKMLGITQPLLYRYFSNKQALIDRVYQTVFEGRWNPAWIALLKDRSVPFRDRLCGLQGLDEKVSDEEMEFVWSLHGGIFYSAVRHHVYKIRMTIGFMTLVGFAVDNFLAGAQTTYPRLIAAVASSAKVPIQKSKSRSP